MKRESGFVLLAVLGLFVLGSALVLLVHRMTTSSLESVVSLDEQLHAQVLSENGVAAARALLRLGDPNELLAGRDRTFGEPGSRNPIEFDAARRFRPGTWSPAEDDGYPSPPWEPVSTLGRGFYLFRFSNNPEEGTVGDEDGVLLVRSMGIVPSRLCLDRGECLNQVAMIEAKLRKELVFHVVNPVTLFGSWGEFEFKAGWEEAIRFGEERPFGVIQPHGAELAGQLALALGRRDPASVLDDRSQVYRENPNRGRIFDLEYWLYLEESLSANPLPGVRTGGKPSVAFLAEGGRLDEFYKGVLWARGDLTLGGGTDFTGLLIHLGGGRLEFEPGARLSGAVWASDPLNGTEPGAGRITLRVSSRALVEFDRQALDEALVLLPPTLLGWRMLFPEMAL